MGFEEPVADGAELTSLSKKQQSGSEESWISASAESAWQPIELLKKEKKKDDLMSADDPVGYAVKGAEPVGEAGNPQVEPTAPKRLGASSMARSTVQEPVDGNLQITPLKPNKVDSFAKKETSGPYTTIGTEGGSEHMFAAKQGGGNAAYVEKKDASQPLYLEKKMNSGEGQSAFKQFSSSAQQVNIESQLSIPAGSVEKLQMPQKLESSLSIKPESNPAGGQSAIRGANFFEQPDLKGVSSATFHRKDDGQQSQQIGRFNNDPMALGERPGSAIEKMSLSSGSTQGAGPPDRLSKMVGTGSQTPFEYQKGFAAGAFKPGEEIQQQLAPRQPTQQIQNQAPELKKSFSMGESSALSKTESVATNLRAMPENGGMKVDLTAPSKDMTARPAVSQEQSLARKLEPGATTGNGINIFAPELPSKSTKIQPQASQAERFTVDPQMRAQADRISAGAQMRAAESHLAGSLNAKDKQAAAQIKPQENQIATPIRQHDLQTGTKLKGEVSIDQTVPFKAGRQPQIQENGLQPKLAQVKTQPASQSEIGMQPRVSPLTGKTQQDLISVLKPQDKPAARALTAESPVLADRKAAGATVATDRKAADAAISADRRIAASTPLTGKLAANGGEALPSEKRGANPVQIAKGDISRSFEQLMSGAVKNNGDRYVGGEFLLASMIIAAGAARRMPERTSESQNQAPPSVIEIISKAFNSGKNSEQSRTVESTLPNRSQPGQSESVRYISGVELAILLAAGGISKLRHPQEKGQSPAQTQDDAAMKPVRTASASSVNLGNKPLASGADKNVSTPITANMPGPHTEIQAPFAPSTAANTGAIKSIDKPNALPNAEQTVKGERCIPGADVAIAAMLILAGAARKRTQERMPANPDDLAEKVDRPWRLDRRLGGIVAQAKSFVVREPMPVCGMRATAANIVSSGEFSLPHQYKQGAVEQKQNSDGSGASIEPTGWMHEPVGRKEVREGGSEVKLKASEQEQQSGAAANASKILYRPMWIIAPGETFVSIAEEHFADGSLAWLIADLNRGKFSDSMIEGKRVIEIQARQRIELPVASDIEEFRHSRMQHQDAENLITIVTASQLDIELKEATFKQFLGTLQNNLPIPAVAALPQLDLVQQPKPQRVAAFGMSAPQFASIAAAVSLPLIIPHLDMVQKTSEPTVHIQEIRSETAKPEETA